jgi:hypothetical protein
VFDVSPSAASSSSPFHFTADAAGHPTFSDPPPPLRFTFPDLKRIEFHGHAVAVWMQFAGQQQKRPALNPSGTSNRPSGHPFQDFYMNRSFIFDQLVFFGGRIIFAFATPFFSAEAVAVWVPEEALDEEDVPPSSAAKSIPAPKIKTRKYLLIFLMNRNLAY